MTDGTPTLISGSPKAAVGVTTRRSQARASSNAPPRQYPPTAATVTTGDRRMACMIPASWPMNAFAPGLVHADERLDVHPRAERRRPGAREDQTRDARIEIHDDVPESGQVFGVQHVQLAGPVEGDPQIRPATIDCDVSHALLGYSGVAAARFAAATSVRFDTPSLANTDETWWSTVFGEITSLAAMLALVRPSQSNSSTSCSRWVRPSGFSRVAARCPAGTDRMPSERIFWRMIRAVATAPSALQMSSARRSASSSGASNSASAAS